MKTKFTETTTAEKHLNYKIVLVFISLKKVKDLALWV